MLMGGGSATAITAGTEAFDAANPSAGWVAKAPLPQPRHDLNTVILPDGQLLTVGGNSATDNRGLPQHEAELYTPGHQHLDADGRARPRTAPTTRRRCCCPTGA